MTAKGCKFYFAGSLAVIFAALLLLPAFSRAEPVEQVTINHVEAAAAPDRFANEVRAYITVSTAGQKPIGGLTASAFEALEDGRPVTVAGVARSDDPMAVVLVVDTSGSMQARDSSGRTSMQAARQAASGFIAMLSSADRVALFSFNKEPRLCADFGSEHKTVLAAVQALAAVPNAYTCLYDSAFEAVQKAAEIPKGRRAVILLTDGRDEKAGGMCSAHPVGDVIDLATTRTIRVPIYTIGVGARVDAQELKRIADLTGGRSMLATSLGQLKGFYQTLAAQLKHQYLLTYDSQAASGEHSLVVKVRAEEGRGQDEKRFWSAPLPVRPPPRVSFVSVVPGAASGDLVTVRMNIAPEDTIARVRFYVDGLLQKELTKPPFAAFDFNAAGLAPGRHILRVEALDIRGQSAMAEMNREFLAESPAGGKAGNSAAAGRPEGVIWLAAIVALMLAGGSGGIWWLRRRRKGGAPSPYEPRIEPVRRPQEQEQEAQGLEDETVFFTEAQSGGNAGAAAEAIVPAATLTVLESPGVEGGRIFRLWAAACIGRGEENDIPFTDKAMSRKHAEVYFDSGRFYIRDLGSKYGTKVDGSDAGSARMPLSTNARIQLGPRTALQFEVAAPPEGDHKTVTGFNPLKPDEKTDVVDPD